MHHGERDLRLFMDDVGFIDYGTNHGDVVERINRLLSGIHSWSRRNCISFPFKKFHLINIVRKKLPGRWKNQIR